MHTFRISLRIHHFALYELYIRCLYVRAWAYVCVCVKCRMLLIIIKFSIEYGASDRKINFVEVFEVGKLGIDNKICFAECYAYNMAYVNRRLLLGMVNSAFEFLVKVGIHHMVFTFKFLLFTSLN